MNDDIDNVIVGTYDEKHQFICCRCPRCRTIFTIALDERPSAYGRISMPCPKCRVTRDWLLYRISKVRFKFIRWWRQRKERTYSGSEEM